MQSRIILMKSTNAYGHLMGFDNLIDAMNMAVSGDNISIQFPGTYDLGANSLTLKNGVNIFCVPGVAISSSNTNGTLIDNNSACVMSLKGFPTLTNTNGLDKRIVLSNANSKINDFWWEFVARINQSGTNAPTIVKTLNNTLGGTPIFSRSAAGSYALTLAKAFIGLNNCRTVPSMYVVGFAGMDQCVLHILTYPTSADALAIVFLKDNAANNNYIDNPAFTSSLFTLDVRVYP